MTTHSTKLVKFLRCLVIVKFFNYCQYITSTVTSQELERINCLCRLYLRSKDTLALRLPGKETEMFLERGLVRLSKLGNR